MNQGSGAVQMFPPDFYWQVLVFIWFIVRTAWWFFVFVLAVFVLRVFLAYRNRRAATTRLSDSPAMAVGTHAAAVPLTEPAASLAVLADLKKSGAITSREWKEAKRLVLEQHARPSSQDAARIADLYGLRRQGALTEAEFNTQKWAILSQGR